MAKITEKQFWEYVEKGFGVFFKIKKEMKKDGIEISRQAIHQRCNKDDETKSKLREIRKAIVDKAEKTMLSLLDSKDHRVKKDAAKFILETLGKNEGYTTRTELTGKDSEPLSIKVEIIE